MKNGIIYADNAATTKLDIDAFEAMKRFLLEEYGNPSAKYSFSRSSSKVIKEARYKISECIGAEANEIYFTSGGTEGDNWILKSMQYHDVNKKHIITSCIEHHAILESCHFLEEHGFTVTYLPVNKFGQVESEALKKAIRQDTVLVSIMLANNEVGTIQNIAALTNVAHAHDIFFHTDAVQAVGHIPVDVNRLGVDFLTASAHKFNGCKGTGFVYIRDGVTTSSLLTGGVQEKRKRAGTENVAGIVAMSVALENNCKNMDRNIEHTNEVVSVFLNKLSNKGIDYIRNGAEVSLPGVVSVSFRNAEGEMLMHRLDLKKIYVSTGAACNSKQTVGSHVLKAMQIKPEYINGTIRVSLGKYNNTDEAVIIADAIADILK